MKPTSFPPGPKNWYPLRIALAMQRDPISFLAGVVRTYGDFTHFKGGEQHVFLLNRPDYIRQVFQVDADKFEKSSGSKRARALIGDGLLISEGEKHHRQRRLIQPSFNHRKVTAHAPTIVDCGLTHMLKWRDGSQVDMFEELRRLTLTIIGKTMFGLDIEKDTGYVLGDFSSIVRLFDSMSPMLKKARTLFGSKGDFSQVLMRHQAVLRIIEKRRENPTGEDLLSALIAAVDDGAMDEKQLRDEVVTILEAGHETTSTALGWTWYLLSNNPEVERKFHEELERVLDGRPPDAEDFARLTYTVNVFTEAMRMYPPVWVIGRTPTEDYELDGFLIPKGSLVLISPHVLHYDQRHYKEPERFIPDRWRDDRETIPPLSYLPFGYGPRRCVGEGFAMLEGSLLLATLGQNWRPRMVAGHIVKLVPLIVLRPNGLQMILNQRNR
ncbi:MAG TPA: cytochrome P450 [Pyrinomonadaceae bacterium]|nr:cytochrome P450 [Pyrinomonadaceae bacterium]